MDEVVETVSVVEPDDVLDARLKLPVAPAGRPFTPNVTDPLKPVSVVMLTE